MNQSEATTTSKIMRECDYSIACWTEEGELIRISPNSFRAFTLSFNKESITLSAYVGALDTGLNIQELQKAKLLKLQWVPQEGDIRDIPVQTFEILNINGSSQGNLKSPAELNYVITFTLK